MNTGVRGRMEVAPMPQPAQAQVADPTSGDRPFSPGLPPSYAEALQHRTVEYGCPPIRDPFYAGPPPPLPAHCHLGHGPIIDGIERMPDDTQSRASADESTESCMKMTLPPMHMCMAVTCLIFNFLIPGFGTMLAAFAVFCCTNGNEWTVGKKFGACCLNFTIGVAQLVLTPLLLLGWIWSILWGFAFVGVSSEAYHGRKRTAQAASLQIASRQAHCMAANQRPTIQEAAPTAEEHPPTGAQLQVQTVIHVTDLQRHNSDQREASLNAVQGTDTSRSTCQSQALEQEMDNAPVPSASGGPVGPPGPPTE